MFNRHDYLSSGRRRGPFAVLAMLCALGLALLVTACGSSGDSSTSSSSSSTTQGGTASTTATSAGDTKRAAIPVPTQAVADAIVKKLPSLDGKRIAFLSAVPIEYLAADYNAAKQAVQELGGTLTVFDAAGDPTKELGNVRTAITQKYDAILGYTLSQASAFNVNKLAKAAGIPYIQYYAYTPAITNAQKSQIHAWVGSDAYDIGKISGEQFVSKLKPGDDIAIIRGFSGTAEVTEYERGFRSIVVPYGLKIVATPSADWVRQKAFAAAQGILSSHPGIKGLYCMNDDQSAGCVAALRAAGKRPGDVAMSALNVSPTGIDLIKQGWMIGGASMSPALESAIGVRLAAQFLAGQQPRLQPVNRCWYQNQSITKDNLGTLDPATTFVLNADQIRRALATPCLGQATALAK